ncbi:MAG: hypothetical protein ACK56I_23795, partial [bacterium]
MKAWEASSRSLSGTGRFVAQAPGANSLAATLHSLFWSVFMIALMESTSSEADLMGSTLSLDSCWSSWIKSLRSFKQRERMN